MGTPMPVTGFHNRKALRQLSAEAAHSELGSVSWFEEVAGGLARGGDGRDLLFRLAFRGVDANLHPDVREVLAK